MKKYKLSIAPILVWSIFWLHWMCFFKLNIISENLRTRLHRPEYDINSSLIIKRQTNQTDANQCWSYLFIWYQTVFKCTDPWQSAWFSSSLFFRIKLMIHILVLNRKIGTLRTIWSKIANDLINLLSKSIQIIFKVLSSHSGPYKIMKHFSKWLKFFVLFQQKNKRER